MSYFINNKHLLLITNSYASPQHDVMCVNRDVHLRVKFTFQVHPW